MSRPAAVVTGMIASYNVGGVLWDYGQYALGLERLGFDVYYLEDTGWEAYDPRVGLYGPDYTYGIEFLGRELDALSPTLGARWHVRAMDGETFGIPSDDLVTIVQDADVFLNVSGAALVRQEYLPSRRKVLIDTDPGWNHFRNYRLWDLEAKHWYGTAGWRAHDHYFTYAERIGQPGCRIPDMGVQWSPTRPPVVLDCWSAEPPGDTWTTVMTWDNFRQPIEHDGETYGTKELEFVKVESLPLRVDARVEVAVGGNNPPLERWRDQGWSVVDSVAVSKTADDYRRYVQRSRGELSVAKNVYVSTRSGWFSCRSSCYLASGRPVVVQDTGFSDVIATGAGLLAFDDVDGAIACLNAVEKDYEHHRSAAREVASTQFAHDKVLDQLLGRAGVA
jgi:hypothetical protein